MRVFIRKKAVGRVQPGTPANLATVIFSSGSNPRWIMGLIRSSPPPLPVVSASVMPPENHHHLPLRETMQQHAKIIALHVALGWVLGTGFAADSQHAIERVQLMAKVPEPLVVRDWPQLAKQYYELLLNPATRLDGKPLVVLRPDRTSFDIPSWVGGTPADEAFTCLIPVIGANLVGLDPRNLHGFDYVLAAKGWFDERYGVYRHTHDQGGQPVYHADIYGYWAGIQGLMLASQYPGDPDFQRQALATTKAFLRIARGMGCPANADFDALGFNFATGRAAGRPEPMNRLGHAPSVAWPLLIGYHLTGDRAMLDCARAAMQWHIDHPGRYEVSHVMGPLTAVRLNAEYGCSLDLDRVLKTWFGQGDNQRMPWKVTAGMRCGGITCDGLDGADWTGAEHGFHAFAMGSLQGPAWLVPATRYDARYARDIGRYALNAANSARLFQGVGLDWKQQDHKDWKDRWDPQNLLFHEAVTAWSWDSSHRFRPYATGDPVRLGWGGPPIAAADYDAAKQQSFSKTSRNLALYMGNHIGFLGGIVALTDVPGVLRWDCLATDWFHAPAYPTYLLYNPHPTAQTFHTDFGGTSADLYDAVTHEFVQRDVCGPVSLTLAPETAAVIVVAPAGGRLSREGRRTRVDGVVVDYENCGLAPATANGEVWMMPPAAADGRCLRQLFTQPDQWVETRSLVQVLGYADHQLDRQFTDDELRVWLPLIERWGLKFGLEVGAVKQWGTTGAQTFAVERKLWDRFLSLGGRIDALAMDEPLCCVRKDLKKSDAYAVEETANFVALVRKNYPTVRIGDIEPYPFLQREELLAFLDALQARLKELNVRGLDFFRLDVDWNHFTIGNRIYPGNWPDVKQLELACRQRKLPFSLIYWAADYGRMKELNLADDATWYLGVMRQGNDYAFVGGAPDQYVIESWVDAPSAAVPETAEWTFTRSVRDFSNRFVMKQR
ncbi:MAG: hypothetical protein K9N23_05190 [Akkermansiaceae bacterium]|nr:hypothetical protein [Akkermansiaceae bacterium]